MIIEMTIEIIIEMIVEMIVEMIIDRVETGAEAGVKTEVVIDDTTEAKSVCKKKKINVEYTYQIFMHLLLSTISKGFL